jgi:cell wall-associated NlpC family hydrolase
VKLIINIIFIPLFAAGIIAYSGCAPASNSVRYNEREKKEEKKSPVRYSSEDKTVKNNSDTTIKRLDYTDDEDLPLENNHIDISSLVKKNNTSENGEFTTVKEKILMDIMRYLNTPYKFGGTSKSGIDCSAFTQTVFNDCTSIKLLRTAQDQYTEGTPVENVDDLKFGDLVFFDTRRSIRPGHVGIYLGDDLFAHASSRQGVTVSSIDQEYYSKRFMGGRRIEELYGSNSLLK